MSVASIEIIETEVYQDMNMERFFSVAEVEAVSQLLSRSNISGAKLGGVYRSLRQCTIMSSTVGQYAAAVGIPVEEIAQVVYNRTYSTDLENYDPKRGVASRDVPRIPCPHCSSRVTLNQFNVDLEMCLDGEYDLD